MGSGVTSEFCSAMTEPSMLSSNWDPSSSMRTRPWLSLTFKLNSLIGTSLSLHAPARPSHPIKLFFASPSSDSCCLRLRERRCRACCHFASKTNPTMIPSARNAPNVLPSATCSDPFLVLALMQGRLARSSERVYTRKHTRYAVSSCSCLMWYSVRRVDNLWLYCTTWLSSAW